MFARDIMTHEVISICPTATIRDAARLLSDYNISGAPVIDREGRMVGIVTQADLISKEGETVRDIMTEKVVVVREHTPVDRIAQILTSNRFKRVPVVRDERVVGIVSRADIVRMMASRWVCPVCGEIQHGRMPDVCYSCGADGSRFERELEPRPEITTRQ
ncbi:MAG TPA: CBS domain-containing protein [Ktedonobacterales bacterium]|jgi:CBS-domain-containing membrane protein|nr:CBS domain-containing protein [Ktedonobacterales bacterium]